MTPSPSEAASRFLVHYPSLGSCAERHSSLAATTTRVDLHLHADVRLARQSPVVSILHERDIIDLLVEGPHGPQSLIAERDARSNPGIWPGEYGGACSRPARTRLVNILVRGPGGAS